MKMHKKSVSFWVAVALAISLALAIAAAAYWYIIVLSLPKYVKAFFLAKSSVKTPDGKDFAAGIDSELDTIAAQRTVELEDVESGAATLGASYPALSYT